MIKFVLLVAGGIAIGVVIASAMDYPSSTGGWLGAAIGVAAAISNVRQK